MDLNFKPFISVCFVVKITSNFFTLKITFGKKFSFPGISFKKIYYTNRQKILPIRNLAFKINLAEISNAELSFCWAQQRMLVSWIKTQSIFFQVLTFVRHNFGCQIGSKFQISANTYLTIQSLFSGTPNSTLPLEGKY